MAESLSRTIYDQRVAQYRDERKTWEPTWKDVAEYLIPRKVQFNTSDSNKGSRKDSKIINSYATKSLHVLTAGLHAGVTSPARPWHRISVPDANLMDRPAVKSWLYATEQRQRMVFAQSNLYNGLSAMYEDTAAFGTGVLYVDDDSEDVVRAYNVPLGSYWLGTDERGVVNCVTREIRMTVVQCINKFGYANCSSFVKSAYDGNRYTDSVAVIHLTEPRDSRDVTRVDAVNMPFRSLWWEKDSTTPAFLKVSGYEEFPYVVFRWSVTGTDVYGWGPGQDALGDIKAVQTLEKRKAQLIDKMTNPPMMGPASLRNQRSSLLPGDMTYLDGSANGAKFEPVQRVEGIQVQAVTEAIAEHIRRIGEVFLTNMWLMMSESDRREITAREVDERHEEKMLQLGPTLERLHDEVLDPLIDRVFGIMLRRGLLPQIPPDLSGASLKVEYVSIMAQAQKVLSTGSIDRLTAFIANLGSVVPSALDVANWDDVIKTYADNLGVKPSLVRSADEVAALRQARQAAQAQAQQQEQAQMAAKTAQSLARAPTDSPNALTQLMQEAGGDMATAQQSMGPEL